MPNTFYPPSEVLVRRIDHLLTPSAVVAVMKLDVEGFGRSTLGSRGPAGASVAGTQTRHDVVTRPHHGHVPAPTLCFTDGS